MIKNKPLLLAVLCSLFVSTAAAKNRGITIQQLIANHLASIGTPAARNAAVTRFAVGTVHVTDIIAGQVDLNGAAEFISQGNKVKAAFKFGIPQYPGEQFVFTGKEAEVGMTGPNKRSALGQFLFTQPEILRDGLLGGTMSTAWPLLNLKEKNPKLKLRGLKKVDGRDLYEVEYISKHHGSGGDLTVLLYFDPQTYQHVLSVYRLTLHDSTGQIQQGTDQSTQTVEERFGDFKTTDGVTLPYHWIIRYRVYPGKASELQWDVHFTGMEQKPM